MAWITPKLDWNSNDYYNYGDLNRVENNINEVKNLILTYVFNLDIGDIITTRTVSSIEYYTGLNRIESNILALRNATYQPIGWITPKTNWQSVIDGFGYTDANRLENNVLALYTQANNTIDAFLYCGTFNCGQGNTRL